MRFVPLMLVIALGGAACTSDPADPPPSSMGSEATSAGDGCPAFVREQGGGACDDTFELDGRTYRVVCEPVPELLLDVPVGGRWAGGPVRAIAAVAATHAVAVTANDGTCGEFALALAVDLSETTRAAIISEVERAASLPADLEK